MSDKAKGLFIGVDGTVETREFTVGESYEVIRNAVNGWIECAVVGAEIDLWLNEEGKLIGLEPNRTATYLFWNKYGIGSDIIVGDVFLTSNDGQGETTGLTPKQVDFLKEEFGLIV
jgi:hypothetical protein